MARERTKRAEILLEVLDCINRDAYAEFEGYLIFGGSLEDLLWDADHPGHGVESHPLREVREFGNALGKVIADMLDGRARTVADRRTSLKITSEKKLPVKGSDRHSQLYKSLAGEIQRQVGTTHDLPATLDSNVEWDLLDRKYAKEVLDRLSRIVHRVSALHNLDIQGIPNDKAKHYFEEAHRCYAYGFPVACAVLCRALIESALQQAINFRLSLQNPKTAPPRNLDVDSNKLDHLIMQARELGLLSSDGRVCADDVRKAGNWAIHPDDFERFRQNYGTDGGKGVVANTRKVLQELYGQVETR